MSVRKSTLLFFVLLLSAGAAAQIYIVKDPVTCLYGLKDNKAKWILQPSYTLIETIPARPGKYKVMLNSKNGIIDKTGKIIIPLLYNKIEPLGGAYGYEDDSILRDRYNTEAKLMSTYYLADYNRQLGIIDSTGKEVLPFLYQSIEQAYNAVYIISTRDGKNGFAGCHGLISYLPEGHRIIRAYHTNSWEIYPRKYIVVTRKANKTFYGVCNEKSEMILAPEFESITGQGAAIGAICAWTNGKAAFYDKTGKALSEHVYQLPEKSPFSSPNMLLVMKDGKSGIIGKNAVMIIACEYDSLKQCNAQDKQFIFLGYKNRKWGLYEESGRLIIPHYFENMIREGAGGSGALFYAVRSEGKWGALDETGNELLETRYDTILRTNEGLLFWSPEDAAMCRYCFRLNLLYLPGYVPKEEEQIREVFLNDDKYYLNYWYDYDTETDSNNICRLQDKTDRDYRYEKENEKKKAKDYRYARILGYDQDFFIYHIDQIISPDSAWHLVSYRPGNDRTNEVYFEGFRPEYPQQSILVHRKSEHQTEAFMDGYEYRYQKADFFMFSQPLQSTKSRKVVLKNDMSYVRELLHFNGARFCCYTKKGKPVFVASESNERANRQTLIDDQENDLVPKEYSFVEMINSDTAWVMLSSWGGDCRNRYNLFSISAGRILLTQDEMLLSLPGPDRKLCIAANVQGYDFYDTEKIRFSTQGHYRLLMPFPVEEKEEYFTALTQSGKTVFTDRKGNWLTDSMQVKIVCPLFQNWNVNAFRKDHLPFVIVKDNSFYRFEKNKLEKLDATAYKQIIDKTSTRFGKRAGYDYDGIRFVCQYYPMEFNSWQYALLMDSIFRSPLFSDYRMAFNGDVFDERDFIDQRHSTCGTWSALPPELRNNQYRYALETTMAGPAVFSYQRSGYSIESSPHLRNRSYYNYLLYADTAVCIPLDSLFEGYAWKDFLTALLNDTLEANPTYDAPCINASAYPFLLRYRFLITSGKLLLYPEWTDKRYYHSWYEYQEFEIEIPWKILEPYLKPEVRAKLGLN